MILFPILVTVIFAIIAPISAPLIGTFNVRNLIKETAYLDRLSKAAQNELSNIVTLLLGITIRRDDGVFGFSAAGHDGHHRIGLVAFVFERWRRPLCQASKPLFRKRRSTPWRARPANPRFPMAARLVQKLAKQEDPTNFVLMQAASANVAGQLARWWAGSMILAWCPCCSRDKTGGRYG
jgi:oxaloacetate decarboxylase beta subunit